MELVVTMMIACAVCFVLSCVGTRLMCRYERRKLERKFPVLFSKKDKR